MNTDPASSCSIHLDLEDLTSEANGQAISDQAREHLAACGHCRAEANRWSHVAGGVRSLVAATPQVAQPARPQHTRPQVPAGPRRRTSLAASVAAALVLIGGASYGVSAALTGHAPRTAATGTTAASLTSVNGCASLKQADGTLEQVTGTSLVIKTATGQRVTVTTTASTRVSMLELPLSYITDGRQVMVAGPRTGGTITAAHVTFERPRHGKLTVPPGFVAAHGTVTRAVAAGFTLVTSSGTRIPVTTSIRTQVNIPQASLGQLRTGVATIAVGHVGPHGTLSAMGVLQAPGQLGKITVKGCSPGSVDDAITTALVTRG